MKLLVNGEMREVQQADDIATLVAELGLPAPTVLIEHNGLALRRDEWAGRKLAQGDQIEVLRISAGG
jgi:sulfur carrier protein